MICNLTEKTYWYYSNGHYELKSGVNEKGEKVECKRQIYGEVPIEEVYEAINDGKEINPHLPNWKEEVVARLAKARFYTDHICNIKGGAIDLKKGIESYRPLQERGISLLSYSNSR